MALVTGKNLARSFGANDIFTGVTVGIPNDARIALVGPNGSGKTTLLRLLARLDPPTEGKVTHAQGLRLGFLPQEASLALEGEHVLWDEMLTAFTEVLELEVRLHDLAESLAAAPDDAALLETYGEAQQRFETLGGYDYTVRIQQVLGGLGFPESDFSRPVKQLSGGEKTRALLARLLLENPDFLILDEPTNHLDIEAIEWLEGWVRNYQGALLIVSHDRYFMDAVVDHIWELTFGRLEEYRGNYSHYVQQREARWERADQLYEQEKERLEKEIDFIKRNMGSRGTTQAMGRLRRLTRQVVAIEEVGLFRALDGTKWSQLGLDSLRPFSVEEAEQRVRSLPRPPKPPRPLRLNLQTDLRSGDKVLMTRGMAIGYPDDRIPLFEVPDITLYRGECAALIGPNGAGKSTFLKTILGKLEPLEGESEIGASVQIGYFAQAHEGLVADRTVIEEIQSAREMRDGEARSYLAQFLFTSDDVYKTIDMLSGGERGRVALAKLALGGANLLLLDEPTNHLDIPSQEILETVLTEFHGTILLVSHDRYLIRDLATQIWALHVPRKAADGPTEMVVYEGPYTEYLNWREARSQPEPVKETRKPQPEPKGVEERPRSGLNPYQRGKRLKVVEDRIHQLEVLLVDLSGALEAASVAGDVQEVTRLGQAYTQAETELNALMEEWEGLIIEA